MNKLIEVLEVQTYSRKDSRMITYLIDQLSHMEGVTFMMESGNIYATKGVAPYPCMIAHTDTVHQIVEDLTAITIDGKITGFNKVKMEQTGIGGDDKVGIYVALEMLKEFDNIKAFFPRDEEIGCVGSSFALQDWFDDVTIALQCDRRGNTDFITNASGVQLSSKAFQDDVLPILTEYGYKFAFGMMTDVMELKESGIKASMANISCGYYNPHSKSEYVDVADVHKVTTMVSHIIKTLGRTYYPHEIPQHAYADKHWWDDESIGGTYEGTHMGFYTPAHRDSAIYCNDCGMKPATGRSGLCDECWEWFKSMRNTPIGTPQHNGPAHVRMVTTNGVGKGKVKINYNSKPEYGQTKIIKNVKDVVKYLDKKGKRKTFMK